VFGARRMHLWVMFGWWLLGLRLFLGVCVWLHVCVYLCVNTWWRVWLRLWAGLLLDLPMWLGSPLRL
jgi:hypothetical protein